MTAKSVSLAAQSREVLGKKVKRLRLRELLPAVVYGHGLESSPITINAKEFKKVFGEAGTSTLVDLSIDEKKSVKVLIHEPQLHYLSGEPVHVDFYAVKMTEKIETAIPIHFVGVSAAVEEQEGNFIANKDELNIRCFPGDLIPSVEVDISVLKTFEDQVRVKDIQVPENIEIMDEAEDVIALVAAPISEAELEAELAEDVSAEAAAVAELGKEDEAVEGENPLAGGTESKDQDKDEPSAG